MIDKELLFLDTSLANQNDVLITMIDKAKQLGYLKNEKEYLDVVLEREKIIPTSIGFKVAIPHGKTTAVNKPFVAFMKTKEEFEWNVSNGEFVDFIFMIGVPEENENNLHLKCLSLISKKLMQEEFRTALRTATDIEETFHLLNDINQKIQEV